MGLTVCASTVTYDTSSEEVVELGSSLIANLMECSDHRISAFDFVVVINDSEPERIRQVLESVEALEQDIPGFVSLTAIHGHGNVGYGAAQNLALRGTTYDYHLILNPDVKLAPGCLNACLSYLRDHEEAVMVVPRAFDTAGNYAWLAKRRPNPTALLLRALAVQPSAGLLGRQVGRYVYADLLPSPQPVAVEYASGCFMFCRGDPLRRVGGFDERYFLYFEDYDLSQRIRRYGTIVEIPDALVVHRGGRTIRRGVHRIWMFLRSGMRFFRSYGWS